MKKFIAEAFVDGKNVPLSPDGRFETVAGRFPTVFYRVSMMLRKKFKGRRVGETTIKVIDTQNWKV